MNRIPVINMTATGNNITRLRINAGLTVKDLQDIFGFSTPQAIYKWQRGTALPTVDNLVVLAAVFGVKIDDILIFQIEQQLRIPA
ncbi:MAG: helix-turn-helix transcriptional regulator [Butyrivibrio sp.]|jgi:Predicted transcriptional regulators|nr:helix-turn-helix transcriptional regulator [Clostridia bacterium]MBP3199431.1 helix-turn-helix transcriptional regulator [Butyrivibrio sp.]MBQ6608899.1 helix-turn-helix transcriptional regulator [Oscillospiraceae bacterium]MBR2212794.1 helix-turn-helix transcriptional regulator [Fibrobacter sp.]MBR2257415.1 helix-turn-helix transcriptional regulator [Blautia sp.]